MNEKHKSAVKGAAKAQARIAALREKSKEEELCVAAIRGTELDDKR